MDFSSIISGMAQTFVSCIKWLIDNKNLMFIIFVSLFLFIFICEFILKFYRKFHCTNNIGFVKNDTFINSNLSDFEDHYEDDEETDNSYNTFDEVVLPVNCLNCGALLINGKCQYCGSIFEIRKD